MARSREQVNHVTSLANNMKISIKVCMGMILNEKPENADFISTILIFYEMPLPAA